MYCGGPLATGLLAGPTLHICYSVMLACEQPWSSWSYYKWMMMMMMNRGCCRRFYSCLLARLATYQPNNQTEE